MKMLRKRALAGVLIVSMLLSNGAGIAKVKAEGEENEYLVSPDGLWEYKVATDTYQPTVELGMYLGKEEKVEIPSTIDGKKVTKLNKCLSDMDFVKEVFIPKSVKEMYCSSIIHCPNLEKIEVDEENKVYDSRNHCNAVIETYYNELVIGCKETIIPEGITEIGEASFRNARLDITSINIPSSVKVIGEAAFWASNKLKHVYGGEGLVSIGKDAFCHCEVLETFDFPDTLEQIGCRAFLFCGRLKEVRFSNVLKTIDNDAFGYCTSIKEIYIPFSVEEIWRSTFSGCASVEKIEVSPKNRVFESNGSNAIIRKKDKTLEVGCANTIIPEDIREIGIGAFAKLPNLTTIKIPKSVKAISIEAFYACENLKEIDLPEGLEFIGYQAFQFCSSLKEIRVPEGITSIEDKCFSGCHNMERMYLPASLEEYGLGGVNGGFDGNPTAIYGHAGTYAERLAKEVDRRFVDVDTLVEEEPQPTAEPTAEPTPEPTAQPTAEPAADPTAEPTATPEVTETGKPEVVPTEIPTRNPAVTSETVPVRESGKESAGTWGIDTGKLLLYTGNKMNTKKLTVTGQQEKIHWISADEEVATVDQNGLVKAEAKGHTHIIATRDGESQIVEVTVKNPAIKVSSKKLKIKKSKRKKLVVTTNPSNSKISLQALTKRQKKHIKIRRKKNGVYIIHGKNKGRVVLNVKCGSAGKKVVVKIVK